MQTVASTPSCVGLAIYDGREADVFVAGVTSHQARVRAIGATMLPDRFRLVAAAFGLDQDCVVRERCGKLYLVAFA